MALSIAPGSSGPRWAVHRGTAFESDVLALKDSAGAALDLSDATLRLLIGRSLHAVPTFEALAGTGIVVLDEEGGEIAIRLSAQQTATFPAGVFCYELTVNSGSALVLQLNGGGIASRTLANNLGDAVVAAAVDGLAGLVDEAPELTDAVAATEVILISDPARAPTRRSKRPLKPLLDAKQDSTFTAGELGPGTVERTLASLFAETVSVKSYGAVADGVTDDSAAVSAAIAAVAARTVTTNGFKGIVKIPPGSYRIALSIAMQEGVIIDGYGAQLIGPITGYDRITSGTTVPSASDVDGQTAGACFSNTSTSDTLKHMAIRGLEIKGFRYGICARAFTYAYFQTDDLTFTNCDICVFFYQGAQYITLVDTTTNSCNCLLAAATTCFTSANALKNLNNAFADGIRVLRTRRQLECVGNSDLDTWFESAVLRSASTSVTNGFSGTYALKDVTSGSPLKVSGRAVFIPSRSSRLVYNAVMGDIKLTNCPRGFGLIAYPVNGDFYSINGENMFNDATVNASATESMIVTAAHASIVSASFRNIDAVNTTANVNVKGAIDVLEPSSFAAATFHGQGITGTITGEAHFSSLLRGMDVSGNPRQLVRAPIILGRRAATVVDGGTYALHKVNGGSQKWADEAFSAHMWSMHGVGRLPIPGGGNETNARIVVDGRANQLDGSYIPIQGIMDVLVRRLDTGVTERGRYAITIGGRNSTSALSGAHLTGATSITLTSNLAAIGPGAIITIGGSDRYVVQGATSGSAVRTLATALRADYAAAAAVVCVFEIATISAVAGTICTVTADSANSCIKITNLLDPTPVDYWFRIQSFGTPL